MNSRQRAQKRDALRATATANACPEVLAAVEAGRISIDDVVATMRLGADGQRGCLGRIGSRGVRTLADASARYEREGLDPAAPIGTTFSPFRVATGNTLSAAHGDGKNPWTFADRCELARDAMGRGAVRSVATGVPVVGAGDAVTGRPPPPKGDDRDHLDDASHDVGTNVCVCPDGTVREQHDALTCATCRKPILRRWRAAGTDTERRVA